MLTVEAHVSTTRAARYISQLASHFTHQPGGMTVLSSTPDQLLIDLRGGIWSLRATPDSLVMQVQADDPDHLTAMSTKVADRIEQLGRRDGLHVQWQPSIEVR
jgi:hypothetical protein